MTRRSIHALLVLGSIMLILTSCGSAPAPTEVALSATVTPTTAQPSPTRTPKKPTPTPQPPTATPQPPTPEPTIAPTAEQTPATDTAAPPTPAPIDAPAGWNHYDKSAAGFTFALPPQWNVADLDREDADELVEEMINNIPEMSLLGGSAQDLLTQGIKIIACDCTEMTQPGALPVTLNVLAQPTTRAVPFDQAVQGAIRSLESVPFTIKPINHVRIPHPNGEAEAIQYRMRLTDPRGQPRTYTATQYLLMGDRHILVVTITASIAKAEALTPTFYKIIQTFRLTPFKSQPM
jgi:hypothetical protein